MTPDIKLKDYYVNFKYILSQRLKECTDNIRNNDAIKQEAYKYLRSNEKSIMKSLKLNIGDYNEYNQCRYISNEPLYKKAVRLSKKKSNMHLSQIQKYCIALRNEKIYNELLEQLNAENTITPGQYRDIVRSYYNKVQVRLLEGRAYKFRFGIGTLCIYRVNLPQNRSIVDFNRTNEKKKELLTKGVKLRNKDEEDICRKNGVPYDGVDYRVYRSDPYFYRFRLDKSFFAKRSLRFEHAEYISSKYRGLTYKKIADDYCNSKEDIYELPVDIKVKLNCLTYKYPETYLNFVRNANYEYNKYRKNNSQN